MIPILIPMPLWPVTINTLPSNNGSPTWQYFGTLAQSLPIPPWKWLLQYGSSSEDPSSGAQPATKIAFPAGSIFSGSAETSRLPRGAPQSPPAQGSRAVIIVPYESVTYAPAVASNCQPVRLAVCQPCWAKTAKTRRLDPWQREAESRHRVVCATCAGRGSPAVKWRTGIANVVTSW